MSQQHGYLLRSGTAHNKLLEDKGLAETIKKLSPLNEYPGSLKQLQLPVHDELSDIEEEVGCSRTKLSDNMAATKQDIADLLKLHKSRKTFHPKEFTGKSSDNARDFLSTFKNYCKLNGIDGEDKLLTFEMCLAGAAKCWFSGLAEEITQDFKKIEEHFNNTYIQNSRWLHVTMLENRKLLPTESAENYINDLSELAQLVGVKNDELSKALIRGLPSILKRHVVSFNPTTLAETIQRILLGEATLSHQDDSVAVNSISGTAVATAVSKLEDKIDRLEKMMHSTLERQHQAEQQRERPFHVTCQLCGIDGHSATQCRHTGNNNNSQYLQRNNNGFNNCVEGSRGTGFYNSGYNSSGGFANSGYTRDAECNRNVQQYSNCSSYGYVPKNGSVPRV